jgi:hypothetical protein
MNIASATTASAISAPIDSEASPQTAMRACDAALNTGSVMLMESMLIR